MDFISMVKEAVEAGCSDIHMSSGNCPAYRLHGQMRYWEGDPLTDEDVTYMISQVLNKERFDIFMETCDVDGAATIEGCSRFRINAFRTRNGASLVMRVINETTPELDKLNLPASIAKILELKEGLVLVTGPTGSGKSTTLAAIVHQINRERNLNIVTIEDPVEYLHRPIGCVINQREIGPDSRSYHTALRAVLREDPDIIQIGEIRDFESVSIALSAAETGHLVFSTLHTEGAAKTVDRLVDMFPAAQQRQALGQISTSLKCVVSQRLLPRSDIPGRIGAFEIMFVNSAISNLIRENKIAMIEQVIETSKGSGMITRNKSIEMLLSRGYISPQTAKEYSFDVSENDQTGFNGSGGPQMPGMGMPRPPYTGGMNNNRR